MSKYRALDLNPLHALTTIWRKV